MEAWTGKFEMVDPRLIVFDHRYQRPEKLDLIAAIAANPRWEAFGVVSCFSRFREDSVILYGVDGQQRTRGVLSSDDPPKVVPAVVFPLANVKDEAEVFVRINEYRKSLTAFEKHTGKVVAGAPDAVAVARATEKAGFSIGPSGGQSPRIISAVGALNTVYNRVGEDGLVQTLVQIRESWPDERRALDASIIRLVGSIVEELQNSNGGYVRSKLGTALARTTPSRLLRKAEEIHFDQGTSKHESLRRALKVTAKI